MLPYNVTRNPAFIFTEVDCIAGYYNGEGILPIKPDTFPKFIDIQVTKKYYDLLAIVFEELGILDNTSYAALHWRRGDQLLFRCSETTNLKLEIFNDTSINCHSVEEFISVTKSLLKRENITAPVIVTTNEQSYEVTN
jgi:hypothetical protein